MTTLNAHQIAALNILASAGHPVEDYDLKAYWAPLGELVTLGLVAEIPFSDDADGFELTADGELFAEAAGLSARPMADERPHYCF